MENINLEKIVTLLGKDEEAPWEMDEVKPVVQKKTVFKKEVVKEKQLSIFNPEYIALGYRGQTNIIYSVKRQVIVELTATDFTKTNLLNLFNKDYLLNVFPVFNNKGEKTGFSTSQFQTQLVDECVRAGLFSEENVKGWGIHKDTENNALIINTKEIWGTSNKFNGSRVYNNQVFEIEKDLGVNSNQVEITQKEVVEYFNIINSFNMSRGIQDARLQLGWIGHAFFPGVLGWITHESLTGAAGTGKSTLQLTIKSILGGFAEIVEGNSTEAGIRQLVGNNAGVVLVDESESDSDKLQSILTMFRAASSGMTRVKGTADQKGKTFKLKMAGLLSGIVPPKMNQADNSRFLKIELNRLTNSSDIHPRLDQNQKNWETNYKDYLSDLGKKMCMTLIKNFHTVLSINAVVRNELLKNGYNNRYADTFGILIAFSYYLLNCDSKNHSDDDIANYVKEFNFDKEVSQTSLKDEEELFNQILITELHSDVIKKQNILQHILHYHNGHNKAEVKNLLGRYGIKTEKESNNINVYIDCDDNKLKLLLSNTRFSGGDLKPVLMRMNDAIDCKKEVSIGNIRRSRKGLIVIKLDTSKYKQDIESIDDLTNNEEHISFIEMEKEKLNNEVNELKEELLNLKNNLKKSLVEELKEESKKNLMNNLKDEMVEEIKRNMKELLIEQVKKELKEELKNSIKQEFKNELDNMRETLLSSMKDSVSNNTGIKGNKVFNMKKSD